MKKIIDFLPYFLSFVFILLAGNIFMGDTSIYMDLEKPLFAPPPYVFGIAWFILYSLMLISLYLIFTDNSNVWSKRKAYYIFYVQLIINVIWPIIFFKEDMFLIAFFWILLLIVIVIIMIRIFYKIKPVIGLLQLPYLIWLIFAGVLNLFIYFLN